MINHVVKAVMNESLLDEKLTKYFINPTKKICYRRTSRGTTAYGKKIIVDTYGGYTQRHGGGGAFRAKTLQR